MCSTLVRTCACVFCAGIRFNAEKKRIGSFHSTSIYSFAMKCLFCSGQIVIETDPEVCPQACEAVL